LKRCSVISQIAQAAYQGHSQDNIWGLDFGVDGLILNLTIFFINWYAFQKAVDLLFPGSPKDANAALVLSKESISKSPFKFTKCCTSTNGPISVPC